MEDIKFNKFWKLIGVINREGIEVDLWNLYDCEDGYWSRQFFGTVENVLIKGKVVVVYVKDDDFFAWFKPEKADLTLTMDEDNKILFFFI